MIIEIRDILVSTDIITEEFCCDLAKCKGQCCIEGDAGAPVDLDEIMQLEECLDTVWNDLSASAQAVIDKQGVAYTDQEGDLVTSIVNGKDCVFCCYDDLEIDGEKINNCCLCAIERAERQGRLNASLAKGSSMPGNTEVSAMGSDSNDVVKRSFKPISCSLYPIRVKQFNNGIYGLNYHRWDVCKDAVRKGRELHLPVYKFLKDPLIRRFGKEWYDELCNVAEEIAPQLASINR